MESNISRSSQPAFKRANKNRPREFSSKQPVSKYMDIFQVKKKHHRDPRFDDLSGSFNEKAFEEGFGFLNDIRAREKEELESELKETDDEKRKAQILFLLRRMKNQEHSRKLKKAEREEKAKMKEEIVHTLKEGKKPYFMKKSDEKKKNLVETFEGLKKSGKLEKYLERKRKRILSKDKKRFYQ